MTNGKGEFPLSVGYRDRFVTRDLLGQRLLAVGTPESGACSDALLAGEDRGSATPAVFPGAVIDPEPGCGIV